MSSRFAASARSAARGARICVRQWSLLACAAIAFSANAAPTTANAWARPATAGQAAADVYVDILPDAAYRIVGARSPNARAVEMRVAEKLGEPETHVVDAIELKPGVEYRFALRGNVLRLVDVQGGYGNGQDVPVELDLVDADGKRSVVKFAAQVRGMSVPPQFVAPPPPPMPPAQ